MKKMNRKGQINADVSLFLNVVSYLKQKYDVTDKAIADTISCKTPKGKIPLFVFNRNLSPLQAIVKYLKENENKSLAEISKLLDRDKSTIWITYKKVKDAPSIKENNGLYFMDISKFKSNLSVLEVIVKELKEKYGLRFSKMANLLGRDQRTLWTVYDRAKKKIMSENKNKY